MNTLRQSFIPNISKRLNSAYSSKSQKVGTFLNSPKGVLTLLVLVLIMASSLSYTLYALRSQKSEAPIAQEETVETLPPFRSAGSVGELSGDTASADRGVTVSSTGEEQVIGTEEISTYIFNTSGVIQEINDNAIIILGSGVNFADNISRRLTITITSETIFNNFDSPGVVLGRGPAGLQNLKVGDTVIVASPTNIRGYDTFNASYVSLFSP